MKISKSWKRAIMLAMLVGVGSQINASAMAQGFIITLAVIILGAGLYVYSDMNPLKIIWITAIWSPLFRGLIEYMQLQDFERVFIDVYPDVFFYFSYGVVFYGMTVSFKNRTDIKYFIPKVILSDYVANYVEMSVRLSTVIVPEEINAGLINIALIRGGIILCICLASNGYKRLLIQDAHEERYKKLLIASATFRSELYFMKKNMVEIEDVMENAYALYSDLTNLLDKAEQTLESRDERQISSGEIKSNCVRALAVAKDVHEIKKHYLRVLRGLEDNLMYELEQSSMNLSDLVAILKTDIDGYTKDEQLNVFFETNVKVKGRVKNHFTLMAVLRNLVINSIEAMGENHKGMISLDIYRKQGIIQISVMDNGEGISSEDRETIFIPGYSTKFCRQTGDINRGLGLSLVKNEVEEILNGTIDVYSEIGVYTEFKIKIPEKNIMEGQDGN